MRFINNDRKVWWNNVPFSISCYIVYILQQITLKFHGNVVYKILSSIVFMYYNGKQLSCF